MLNVENRKSSNSAAYPSRTGLDELLPSRHALRLGEIDVLVISDGVLPLPTSMLGHNADPAARAAWLRDVSTRRNIIDAYGDYVTAAKLAVDR